MEKDGNLHISWDKEEGLLLMFLSETGGDFDVEDEYSIDPVAAYDLCKFLMRKFKNKLKAEQNDKKTNKIN